MFVTALREPAYRIYRFRLEELLKIPIGATDEDLLELIEAGFPASISSTIFRLVMIPPGVSEQLISTEAPAVQRLTKDESRRLFRVASVCALAMAIFGDHEKAVRWLSNSKRSFAGQTPLEMALTNQGADEIEKLLIQSVEGIVF